MLCGQREINGSGSAERHFTRDAPEYSRGMKKLPECSSSVYGGPGETRTHNLQLRRLTRYPLRYGSKFVRRLDHPSFYPLWMTCATARSCSGQRVPVQPL